MTNRRPWSDLDGVREWRQYLASVSQQQPASRPIVVRSPRTGETRTFATMTEVYAFFGSVPR